MYVLAANLEVPLFQRAQWQAALARQHLDNVPRSTTIRDQGVYGSLIAGCRAASATCRYRLLSGGAALM